MLPDFGDRVGLAQRRAQYFAWILPSAPAASECNPSSEESGSHWAKSCGQFPVPPMHGHNFGIRNKDSMHARGASHQHLGEAASPPRRPHRQKLGGWMYDRKTRDK